MAISRILLNIKRFLALSIDIELCAFFSVFVCLFAFILAKQQELLRVRAPNILYMTMARGRQAEREMEWTNDICMCIALLECVFARLFVLHGNGIKIDCAHVFHYHITGARFCIPRGFHYSPSQFTKGTKSNCTRESTSSEQQRKKKKKDKKWS